MIGIATWRAGCARGCLIVACAVLAACAAQSPSIDRGAGEELARAESAFSASAATSGVKAAFLGAMADDATLFRPGPVNGKAFMSARPESLIGLEWRSQRVTVAASGELGYSSGPYRLTPNATPDQPAYGQFFTVWRRNASGRWEVLIDLGVNHPGADGWTSPLDVIDGDAGLRPADPVTNAETAFAAVSERGGAISAYRTHASSHIRVLRDGRAPIDGLDALGTLLPDARRTWTLTDSGTSRARDLAWTTGRYVATGPDAAGSGGHYVRVWRAEAGTWKILGEVLAPAP